MQFSFTVVDTQEGLKLVPNLKKIIIIGKYIGVRIDGWMDGVIQSIKAGVTFD